MKKTIALTIVAAALCTVAEENPAQHWNFAELSVAPTWRANPYPESDFAGLKAMLIQGKGPNNTPAEFFAYYGVPKGAKPAGGFPGVVLVHGGGGTCYPSYVQMWVDKGFAVMALDWYNRRPACGLTNAPPREGSTPRVNLPGGQRNDIPANVANMVLSHSLLRTMPEVNPNRTVFVGLSWGSWYGTAVAAVDSRFRGIVEIYCGDWNPSRKDRALVDGRFLPYAKSPMWWFVSTNDQNVTPDSSREGWKRCANCAGHTIVNNLPHSHIGFTFEGCMQMARHFACGTLSLPRLSDATVKGEFLVATIRDAGSGVDHAKIGWTESNDPKTHLRKWQYAPAEIRGKTIRARIPAGARQAYLSAYGAQEGRFHDLCGSTSYIDLKKLP